MAKGSGNRPTRPIKISFLFYVKSIQIYCERYKTNDLRRIRCEDFWGHFLAFFAPLSLFAFLGNEEHKKGFYDPLVDDLPGILSLFHKLHKRRRNMESNEVDQCHEDSIEES
jgi:hypothetical protein